MSINRFILFCWGSVEGYAWDGKNNEISDKKQIRKLKRGKELLIVGSYEKRNEDLFVVI